MRLLPLFFTTGSYSDRSFLPFLAKSTKPASHPIQEAAYDQSLNDYQQGYLFVGRLVRKGFPFGSGHLRAEVVDTLERQLHGKDALLKWAIDHQPDSKN